MALDEMIMIYDQIPIDHLLSSLQYVYYKNINYTHFNKII